MPVHILSLVYKLFELTDRQELGQNVIGEFTIVTYYVTVGPSVY
jgi:hypothetical protein